MKEFFNYAKTFFNTPEKEDIVKLPALRIIFSPFGLFGDNLKAFFTIGSIYAIILTIISIAFGFSYICLYKVSGYYCSSSNTMYFIYSFVRYVLVIMFIVNFHNHIYGKEGLKLKNIFKFDRRTIKTFLVFTSFVLLCAFPMLSYYILYIRVPNPDWIIEIAFFAVISIGFLVPFAAIRFLSLVGFAMEGKELPSLGLIWSRSRNNTLRLLLSLSLILFFVVFIMINFYTNFKADTSGNIIYTGVVSELLYNLIALMFVSILINHCLLQKQFLFKGDKDE